MMPGNLGVEAIVLNNITSSHPWKIKTEPNIYVERGMLGTLTLIHRVKLLQPFSKHTRDQQVSPYNNSFLTITQSHGCKEILFSLLHAKKIADAVLLYVFNIGFPASLLNMIFKLYSKTRRYTPYDGLLLAPSSLLCSFSFDFLKYIFSFSL